MYNPSLHGSRYYRSGSAAGHSRRDRWQRDALLAEQPSQQWAGAGCVQGHQHPAQLCPCGLLAAREGHPCCCPARRCWLGYTIGRQGSFTLCLQFVRFCTKLLVTPRLGSNYAAFGLLYVMVGLPYCMIMLHLHTASPYCTSTLHYHTALLYCIIILHYRTALSYCTTILHCQTAFL